MTFRTRATAVAATLIASTVLAIAAASPLPTVAGEPANRVIMQNKTAAGVWVTVYAKSIFQKSAAFASFCVGPHTNGERSYDSTIYEVRAEVTANANCTGTRLLDGLRGYPAGRGHVGHYFVEAAGHHYIFGNT